MQTIVFLSLPILCLAALFCYAECMNSQPRRAILYGNSLILVGVRACLAALPGLEVLDHPLGTPLELEQIKGATTVIFDMEAIHPDLLLPLLQQPGLQLIGMDPATHRAQIWSGRQANALMAADLVDIIHGGETVNGELSTVPR